MYITEGKAQVSAELPRQFLTAVAFGMDTTKDALQCPPLGSPSTGAAAPLLTSEKRSSRYRRT